MIAAERWPFNAEILEPGSVLSVNECESIVSKWKETVVHRGMAEYSLCLLQLRSFIEKELRAKYGRKMVVVADKMGLRVLTEPERITYADSVDRKARRTRARTLVTLIDTDETQLTDDERKRRERMVEIQSRLIAADARIRRELPAPGKVVGDALPKVL